MGNEIDKITEFEDVVDLAAVAEPARQEAMA